VCGVRILYCFVEMVGGRRLFSWGVGLVDVVWAGVGVGRSSGHDEGGGCRGVGSAGGELRCVRRSRGLLWVRGFVMVRCRGACRDLGG